MASLFVRDRNRVEGFDFDQWKEWLRTRGEFWRRCLNDDDGSRI
jgi:hypothetical protein